MNVVLEFIIQTTFKLLLAIPGSFVRWMLLDRKMSYKQFRSNSIPQMDAFIGGVVMAAMILIAYFVL